MKNHAILFLALSAILLAAGAQETAQNDPLSVIWSYNDQTQILTMTFQSADANGINVKVHILDNEDRTVFEQAFSGKSPLSKQISLPAGAYFMLVNDNVNKIQKQITLDFINSQASEPKTCSELNGKICKRNEVCDSLVSAVDTDLCCAGICKFGVISYPTERNLEFDPILLLILVSVVAAVVLSAVLILRKFTVRRDFEPKETKPEKKEMPQLDEEKGDEPDYV